MLKNLILLRCRPGEGDGEVVKVSLQLLSRVMYYQFECQNFLTQE